MRSYDVPTCIIEFFRHRDLVDSDYALYGSGRAIGWLKMSADAIEELPNELKEAEYYAYAGISAGRTAIDALANWLNAVLKLEKRRTAIDLAKDPFRKLIENSAPSIAVHADRLGALADMIDGPRQQAQHREGLALQFRNAEGTNEQGGWHLAREELQEPGNSIYLPGLLREWATSIEEEVCAIVAIFGVA
jgi:hypothetical protein